jgi:hypothetical protein
MFCQIQHYEPLETMESFLLRRSVAKLVLGRLRERAQPHAIVERCARDVAEGFATRRFPRLSVSHPPQDRFAGLARFPAAVRVTRPAVEWDATGANLDGPEPSPIARSAAHAVDARRR